MNKITAKVELRAVAQDTRIPRHIAMACGTALQYIEELEDVISEMNKTIQNYEDYFQRNLGLADYLTEVAGVMRQAHKLEEAASLMRANAMGARNLSNENDDAQTDPTPVEAVSSSCEEVDEGSGELENVEPECSNLQKEGTDGIDC